VRAAETRRQAAGARFGTDDRAVAPLGSAERRGPLRLATDGILAERVAAEAAEPPGVPGRRGDARPDQGRRA